MDLPMLEPGDVTITSKTTIGTAGELLAAADLTIRGYVVFRNCSTDGVCDLVVIDPRDHRAIRVEVKTGRVGDDGRVCTQSIPREHWGSKFDVLAVVIRTTRQIAYFWEPMPRNMWLMASGDLVPRPASPFLNEDPDDDLAREGESLSEIRRRAGRKGLKARWLTQASEAS